MKLIVHYKNGNAIEWSAYWVETKDDALWFAEKHNPSPVFVEPAKVSMKNIEYFRIEEEA